MKYVRYAIILVIAVSAFYIGRSSSSWSWFKIPAPRESSVDWQCPMHPWIHGQEGDTCRVCGMSLAEPRSLGGGPREISMTEEARKLAEIVTEPVERRDLHRLIRLPGKVAFDETRVKTISARVPGRLDRLYVDYTGVPVKKGDHLVSLYSPDLLVAQEELLSASRRAKATDVGKSEFLLDSDRRAYETARQKLLLWGLTAKQVEAIENRQTASDHLMITSQMSGIITKKAVNEGDYVKTGTVIYEIADLTKVWLRLDAYEQDLQWLRYGQEVEVSAEAFPGMTFKGLISFINPVMNERTRTVSVRVNVDNADGKLRPGMFVRANVKSYIGEAGSILDARLAGKWISPMHPEIVKDGPGQCDKCGMDLVRAEDLGYVTPGPRTRPLAVPVTAPLLTGKRAIVYVLIVGADESGPTYEGRVVRLGPRAGGYYVVLSGLTAGEVVVTNGAFRLDSALQIAGKESMMTITGGGVFRASFQPVLQAYLDVQAALARDDEGGARSHFQALRERLEKVEADVLEGSAADLWQHEGRKLQAALPTARASIEKLRNAFLAVSQPIIAVVRNLGHTGEEPLREVFCPMAFEQKGGAWLQEGVTVRNPYFGSAMPKCGDERSVIAPMRNR